MNTDVEVRKATRAGMAEMASHLVVEFAAVYAPGRILAEVYRAREMLLAQGVRAGLVDATQGATRQRLLARGLGLRSLAELCSTQVAAER